MPIVLGAVVQLVGKPLCFMYPSLGLLAGARLLDRFAKGIRAAPTDALLADLSPTGQQGSVYGLYHSASTLGSIAGGIMVRHVAPPSPRGLGFRFSSSVVAERRHPRRPRAGGLAHPADASRYNLADALGLLSRWRYGAWFDVRACCGAPLALLTPSCAFLTTTDSCAWCGCDAGGVHHALHGE